MQFRKDINGLRAIAVLAVVLFHFNPSWAPGGFAGVDVFFVISGFLMTGIIFRGLEQGKFSVFRFYVARAIRLIPALAVLCLVMLVFGWFYLTSLDYKSLVKHAASSLSFLSNITYWREAGYFDTASQEKWLLHTWSLSVEWQFYIVYPLMLVAMHKFISMKMLKLTVLIGTVIGFLFCVLVTYKWPNPAYYLLPTRAWEMLIGGVAYLYPIELKEKNKKLLEWLGLALVIGSYFLISKDSPWPGYLALFPVLGSFLIIQARHNNGIFTSNIVFQKLGTWSYSIYLWHWPIVVLLYFSGAKLEFAGIALSVFLGFISYRFIELKKIKFFPIAIFSLFLPFFFAIISNDNDLAKAESFDIEREAYLYSYSNPECNFRPYDPVTRSQTEKTQINESCFTSEIESILIHGDSHSQHFYYGLKNLFGSTFDILQISAFSCDLAAVITTTGCRASNELFEREILKIQPEVLILSVRNGYEEVDWNSYISKLDFDGRVLIFGPSPENNPFDMKYGKGYEVINWKYMQDTDVHMKSTVEKLNFSYPNIKYVSMKDLLCSNGKLSCVSEANGVSMYADGGHFSRAGSVEVIRLLKEIIQ